MGTTVKQVSYKDKFKEAANKALRKILDGRFGALVDTLFDKLDDISMRSEDKRRYKLFQECDKEIRESVKKKDFKDAKTVLSFMKESISLEKAMLENIERVGEKPEGLEIVKKMIAMVDELDKLVKQKEAEATKMAERIAARGRA